MILNCKLDEISFYEVRFHCTMYRVTGQKPKYNYKQLEFIVNDQRICMKYVSVDFLYHLVILEKLSFA